MSVIDAPVQDPVPSTYDAPAIIEHDEDAVLALLRNARDRIQQNWTRHCYISDYGEVCAIGAVLAAEDWVSGDVDSDLRVNLILQSLITNTAKEAINLLDSAARILYPLDGSYSHFRHHIEWVNQEVGTKEAVLRCYDEAIHRRKVKYASC